jgi:hypothetical protein
MQIVGLLGQHKKRARRGELDFIVTVGVLQDPIARRHICWNA